MTSATPTDSSRDHARPYTARPATPLEARDARIVVGLPPDADYPVWHVTGPCMNHYFIGVTDSCGRAFVRALNLAYKAGAGAGRTAQRSEALTAHTRRV